MSNNITILNAKPHKEEEKSLELQLNEETLRKEAVDARDLIKSLQYELDQREDDFKDGLSFLDMKNDSLLSYMIDVCNIVLRKVRGETINNHPSIERCVTYRVILEKIEAIDQRLAYQLNRLITLPQDGSNVEEDRVDVNNLDVNIDDTGDFDEDGESDGTEGSEETEGSGETDGSNESAESSIEDEPAPVYKPPKLRSVAYTEEGDNRLSGRRNNYNEFYQDEDETNEIVEGSTNVNRKSLADRIRFEEENYTRLPDDNPKKAKRKIKTKEYRRKGKRMRTRK